MLYVKFVKDGVELTTKAEYWLKYNTFDAVNKDSESVVVNKKDCVFVDTEEI